MNDSPLAVSRWEERRWFAKPQAAFDREIVEFEVSKVFE